MTHLLGISGSLRRQSFNTSLLRAAQSVAGPDVELELATLHGIPLFDADLEKRDGIPDAVTELKERIRRADGVLLATPEYNNGIPGVFKNAIDWLSRPPKEIPDVFGGRPVALLGASPGGFGTILSQAAWMPVLRTLGTRYWAGPKMLVSRAGSVFDENGKLTDQDLKKRLASFVDGFAGFAAERTGS